MLYALSLYSDEINYFSVKLENSNGSTLGDIMAVKGNRFETLSGT